VLRAINRYYEHHVLAWYALGRAREARGVHAIVRELRDQLSTSNEQR
jgi:hypothetical protein